MPDVGRGARHIITDPASPPSGGSGESGGGGSAVWDVVSTGSTPSHPRTNSDKEGGVDDDEDRASIVSLGESDSTNGPFFWYRVVCNISPKGRNCHTASMVGDKMMVFGGFGGSKWFDELWVFDTHLIEWSRPEVRAAGQGSPAARYAHSAVSFRGLLFIFGGYGGNDEWLDDLWVLDTQAIRVRDQKKAAMAWFRPQTTGFSPTPRAAHTASVVGQKLFIFGGNNGSVRLQDLYSLDTQTMAWKKEVCSGSVPAPRAGHTMTLLPAESAAEDDNPQLLCFAGGDIDEVCRLRRVRWCIGLDSKTLFCLADVQARPALLPLIQISMTADRICST